MQLIWPGTPRPAQTARCAHLGKRNTKGLLRVIFRGYPKSTPKNKAQTSDDALGLGFLDPRVLSGSRFLFGAVWRRYGLD